MNEPRIAAHVPRTAWRVAGLAWVTILAAGSFALAPSCLERRGDVPGQGDDTRCASCHGDSSRAGDYLARSAPPRDLLGATSTGYPGVGAHAIHLHEGATHAAIACSECHTVPERTDSPGHADDARPAELVFGPVASKGGRKPNYDPEARTCADGWCHREHSDAVWTEPRSSSAACGSCHGLPPPAPHPQSERCAACHGEVVNAARDFIDAALHVDGIVQTRPGSCSACHGSGDDPAPPLDTLGNQESLAIGVGAHRAHLTGGAFSRPLECSECHQVPEEVRDSGHPEGLPAEVAFTGAALSSGRAPHWSRKRASCSDTWCHGPNVNERNESPSWVTLESSTCASCHGAPPPAPHPQLSDCSSCHAAVVGADDTTIVNRARHVNGRVEVDFESNCTSCHGGDNPAPPRDLEGNSATTFAGVGAHQAHLGAGASSRAVPCAECHTVPESTFALGHIDSALPAEVQFSGAATAFGATPIYERGSCSQTACHGGKFPDTHRSGGTNVTPQWTKVDGTEATCGSCHGLPPPPPHPYPADCSQCHENVASGNATFVHPELHVDGNVTFTVP